MELRAETSVFDDKLLKEDINNAQETADNAQVIAGTTAQYFWFLEEIGSVPAGVGTGAHITNLTKEEFLSNPTNGGGNLLARSNGIAIRDGLTELAIFSADQLRIGRANAQRAVVNSGSLELYDAQNNKYFMVSANGLSYGSHVVATQEDITDIEGQVDAATSSTAVKTQYYLSTSASSATGGSWQDTVPTWSTGKYIWTRVATTKTTMGGTSSTSYSTAVYDRALTTALSTSESAQSSANSGASTVTTTQQFYLSTSSSSATDGSWSDSAPTWSTGHYVWTRYKIVKTTVGGTTSTSYTTGIYDKTLTDALSSAEEAAKTATSYMFVDSNGALNIASANPSTATRKVNISADGIKIQNDANNYAFVTSDGMDIYQGGNSVASFGATARIGKSSSQRLEVKSDGVYIYNQSGTQYGYYGTFARIGDYNSNNVRMDSNGVKINSSQDNAIAEFGSYARIGDTSKGYVRTDSTKINIYVGAQNVASIGQYTVTMGAVNVFGTNSAGLLTPYGLDFHTNDTPASSGGIEASKLYFGSGSSQVYLSRASDFTGFTISSGSYEGQHDAYLTVTGLLTAQKGITSAYCYNNTISTNNRIAINTSGVMGRYASSSQRYKERIKESEFDPHGLYNLKARQFKYRDGYFSLNDNNPHAYDIQVGFIAEEVEKYYPAAAVYDTDTGEIESWEERKIIPPMLTLIQELNDRVSELERRTN